MCFGTQATHRSPATTCGHESQLPICSMLTVGRCINDFGDLFDGPVKKKMQYHISATSRHLNFTIQVVGFVLVPPFGSTPHSARQKLFCRCCCIRLARCQLLVVPESQQSLVQSLTAEAEWTGPFGFRDAVPCLNFHLLKHVVFSPCWLDRQSITTGNTLIFFRGLNQMEVNQQISLPPINMEPKAKRAS